MAEFRIPVAGPYVSRIGQTNTAGAASGFIGIGVVGTFIVGATTTASTKDARYVNCFAQTVSDPITQSKRVYCVKRPGFGASNTPSSGNVGNAVMVWTGQGAGTKVISSFGSTNSTIYDGTTSLGAITGKAMGISETFVSTTATLVVPSNDNTAWYYDTGVAVMTKITDADFPGNGGKTIVGNFAHINGYACIMCSDGTLGASDLNSVTSWTANSFDSANAYPDKGIAAVRYKNTIMAFGAESTQFYYVSGLTPFPLTCNTSATVKVGAVSADAIAQIGDTIFFAGSTAQGGLSVFQFDGSLNRISTPEIDSILILAGANGITLTTIRFYGRSFVICTTGTTTTLVYCVEEKMWHEWSSTTPLWYKCAGVSIGGTLVTYSVSSQSTSGKVYTINPSSLVFTDDSSTYTARAQLPLMDFKTNNKKMWQEIQLICDVESSTSNVSLAYADDDYNNFTTWGSLNLASARPRAAGGLGASRRRAWVLSHSANTPMRIEAIEGRYMVAAA